MVEEIASEHEADVVVPDDFYSLVAQRHSEEDDEKAETASAYDPAEFADLPETELLYYEDQDRTEFEAVVLDVFEREDGYDVILDQTMFYPEGGGQPADYGTLSTDDLTTNVVDVQLAGDVVVHRTEDNPGKGDFVRGQIDSQRRRQHMRHHTATHLVGHAARQVLGDHIRQAGAQKSTDSARLDVKHYESISREEVKEIEQRANELVMENVSVDQEWVDRNDAESEYGFDIYQGGIPQGEQIRLIHADADTQACGGTHVSRTGDIGAIKILGTERIQDGVIRLTYAAGEAAIASTQKTEDALYEAAEILDVSPPDVPETAARFFDEWKARGKRIDELKEQLADARASASSDGEEIELDGTKAIIQRLDGDMDEIRATANALVDDGKVAVIGSGKEGAQFVVGVPDGVAVDAGDVVGELATRVGGGGGGPPDFAQGGGPDGDALDDALAEAPEILNQALNA